MRAERTAVNLSDVAFFQEGPGILAKDFHETGVPLLRLKGIDGPFANLSGCNYLDPDKVEKKWGHFRVSKGDLLISTSASLGRVSLVTEVAEGAIPYTGIIRFRSKSELLCDEYLRAFLSSSEFSSQAESMASGSVIKHFGPSHIKQMTISLPSIEQQKKIGGLNSVFEDAIRSLEKQNIVLESLAQTLFKSWFVNFDPVHAKAAGREPDGLSTELAALFPSEFEESELGLIPKNWKVESIGSTCNFIKGRSYKSSELSQSDVALVTLKSFNRGGGFRNDGFKGYSGQFKPEQVVREGDCIVALTDVTQNAEVIGRPAKVLKSPIHQTLVASLDVGILRPKNDSVSVDFLSCLLREPRYVDHILGYTSGTTVLHLAKDGVPSYKFALPSSPSLNLKFQETVSPIFRLIEENQRLAHVLAELRDELLPRLISGKIRIEEAEEALESVLASQEKVVA